jgi:hypothetical protein
MAKARLLIHDKWDYADGAIAEIKVWSLPEATPERPHGLKYSLFFGMPGDRVVGYDNETGKGDHRHYGKRQESYAFTTLDELLADFRADIAAHRRQR